MQPASHLVDIRGRRYIVSKILFPRYEGVEGNVSGIQGMGRKGSLDTSGTYKRASREWDAKVPWIPPTTREEKGTHPTATAAPRTLVPAASP
jgi:hypothetical protein